MIFSHISTNAGQVTSISQRRDYIPSALSLFAKLDKHNALLLESAEIDSKANLKSLVLVDAALRIECNGNQVQVKALSNNGAQLLPYLQQQLRDAQTELHQDTLNIDYPGVDQNLDEYAKLKAANAFDALRQCIKGIHSNGDNPFSIFLGGVMGYDMVANAEDLPSVPSKENTCPDYVFYLAETLVVIDHQQQSTEIIGNVFNGPEVHANCFEVGQQVERLNALCDDLNQFTLTSTPNPVAPSQAQVDIDDAHFMAQVSQLQQHIIDGDIFQVVPSRTFTLPCTDPLAAYAKLKEQNPSPYMFYLRDQDFSLFGASPESALKYCASSNQVEVYPIAGTRPRGKNTDGSINLDLDSRIELDLRNDTKERAEHIMLVDLARNDVARISQAGTRYVKELLKVDRYSHVMHLVSRVVGQLKEDLDALHAYQACMNMGTLVGAPKVSAARLIREVEQKRRGSYGGAVGYLTGDGSMDSCIVIRSAFVKDGYAHVQAGAGVVYDSNPQSEADETRAKAGAVLSAIAASQSANQVAGNQETRA
ncbi:anthranilate synthase component 1 [Pseudoalteromonas sp. T1lg75]|uniref:anthranilate synthase component 1 n=1 Tax=Pseudoalteromonas sp. T1lg75 TaxID=2077102 RepID=UPI000CF60BB7|nr:anthranilate synthase component 1 [Pseudoalteromonas sp. T1lg75]